jgi:hypothetical protein
MQSQTRRSLDAVLAIGPHTLDAQLEAALDYAARTRRGLGVLWTILPGEDPASAVPGADCAVVVFDDEIARFTADELADRDGHAGEAADSEATDWHVAHATPQPKRPTAHLPVYGWTGGSVTAADAVLCADDGSLDVQLARIEAFALRSAYTLCGVYATRTVQQRQALLRDFAAARHLSRAGPTLAVGQGGGIEVHGPDLHPPAR